MIVYFQHNLSGTNLCCFTHQSKVCNKSYKPVAKFIIKFKDGVIRRIKDNNNRNDIKFTQYK